MLEALELAVGEELIVPTHQHLHVSLLLLFYNYGFVLKIIRNHVSLTITYVYLLQEVYLAKFFNLDIVLRAPLPPVMQWSCKKLGLEIPECKPCEKLLRKDVLRQRAKGDISAEQELEEDIEMGVSTQ